MAIPWYLYHMATQNHACAQKLQTLLFYFILSVLCILLDREKSQNEKTYFVLFVRSELQSNISTMGYTVAGRTMCK